MRGRGHEEIGCGRPGEISHLSRGGQKNSHGPVVVAVSVDLTAWIPFVGLRCRGVSHLNVG